MAFAHGSNDVANAIGPLCAALKVMGVTGTGSPYVGACNGRPWYGSRNGHLGL